MTRGTVVCGVSETPAGRGAAELAGALGARLGLRVVLVHVVDGVPPGTQESLTARQQQARAERALDEIARDIGDGTEKRIMLGSHAEALAKVAAEEGADLVVIGSPPATRKRTEQRLALAAGAATR